jgi:hypothetical protein
MKENGDLEPDKGLSIKKYVRAARLRRALGTVKEILEVAVLSALFAACVAIFAKAMF